MLAILLKILSILGILLLCILAFLIFLLLAVLLCPITYRLQAKGQNKDMNIQARISVFLGLIRILIRYPGEELIQAKVAFLKVFPRKKKEKPQKNAGKNVEEKIEIQADKENEKANEKSLEEDPLPSDDLQGAPKNIQQTEAHDASAAANASLHSEHSGEDSTDSEHASEDFSDAEHTSDDSPDSETKDAWDKAEELMERLFSLSDVIEEKYQALRKKWFHTYGQFQLKKKDITFYIKLLQDEDTKEFIRFIWSRLKIILKSFLPRSIKGSVHYGTGAPDTTAYIFGMYGAFLRRKYPKLLLDPDFDEAVISGDICIKGYFTILPILWHTIRIWFNRRRSLLFKRLKKHKQSMQAAKEHQTAAERQFE